MLYGIQDVNKLTKLLGTAVDTSKQTYKIINKNQLKIITTDVVVYKNTTSIMRENGLTGHTFNRNNMKCYKIVISNLHHRHTHEQLSIRPPVK